MTPGRSLNFAFGAGDRGERPYEAVRAGDGEYEPETTKRLAGLKAAYGPANLLCGNYR
jgi:hypothetical protein